MNFNIIDYSDKYEEKVIRLLKSTFSTISANDYFSPAYFRWKHINNPHGRSLMYIAIDENDEVVGFRSFMCWVFEKDNKFYKALRPVDTATAVSCRGKGLFKKLTFHTLNSSEAKTKGFVFNTPNKNSHPVYLKYGWKDENPIKFNFIPLSFKNTLKKLVFKTQNSKVCNHLNEITTDLIQEFPYSKITNSSYVNVDYLQWRYILNPVIKYFYLKVNNDNCLILRYNERRNLNELYLVDVLSANNSSDLVEIDINKVKQHTDAEYLLLTSDTFKLFKFRKGLSFKMPYPYINLVNLDLKQSLNLSDFNFSVREVELF